MADVQLDARVTAIEERGTDFKLYLNYTGICAEYLLLTQRLFMLASSRLSYFELSKQQSFLNKT